MYSTNVKNEEYDIVVCGSGMIGTAMSSALGLSCNINVVRIVYVSTFFNNIYSLVTIEYIGD